MTVDPDEDLEPVDRLRAVAHRDITRICQTWPAALVDALARGFGSGRTYDGSGGGSGEFTTVEAAVVDRHGNLRPDFATGWLVELGDVLLALGCPSTVTYLEDELIVARVDRFIDDQPKGRSDRDVWNGKLRRLHYLAEKARSWWPDPPTPGSTIRGVTIGARGNQVENCSLCNNPAPSGRNDITGKTLNVTDPDGRTFHRECHTTLKLSPIRARRATA